jgi:hypothetical protein
MRKISGFIISILALLPLLCNANDTIRYPINEMKGIRIGVDFSKFLLPIIYKNERIGFEVTADMHVKGNFFGVAEAGWLNVKLDKRPSYLYKENGFYGRFGVDYNLLKSRRPNSNDLVYGGVRYGFSTLSQQVEQITIPGYFWADQSNVTIPENTFNAQWIEFLLGVKAEVLTNLYVGLTFRLKFLVKHPKDDYSIPYMIPGYGNGNQNYAIGLNYYVAYNFHF